MPHFDKSKSSKFLVWFNGRSINLLREKNKFRKRFKVHKNPVDELSFKLLKNRCEKLSILCYNSYIARVEEKIAKNSKYFWSFIEAKRGFSSNYSTSMTDGSKMATDGTEICNLFAEYFSSVYNNDTVIDSSHGTIQYIY